MRSSVVVCFVLAGIGAHILLLAAANKQAEDPDGLLAVVPNEWGSRVSTSPASRGSRTKS